MMYKAVFVAGLISVASAAKAGCAVDGLRAADDMLDAAIYTWAAVERCNTTLPTTRQDPIRCSLNIASAVEAVNAMVNIVLKSVEACGGFETEHEKCGLAVGDLTKSFAGLAAGSSGVIAKCPNTLNNNKPLMTYGSASGSFNNAGIAPTSALAQAAGPLGFTYCLVNMKDTVKSLFKAMKRVMTLREDCKDSSSDDCAENSLNLVAAIASIGEYTAGAVAKCSNNQKTGMEGACAQESLALTRHVANVADSAEMVNHECTQDAARLFEMEKGEVQTSSAGNSITLGLAAFLPVTAVMAFVAGRRFGNRGEAESYSRAECMDTGSQI